MKSENRESDAPSPDKYVERDVTDLRVGFGRLQEKIIHLENSVITKEMYANKRWEAAKWTIQVLIPLFAAVLGALVISLLK